jgi:thiol-disulfide isomerase/thioredoxin
MFEKLFRNVLLVPVAIIIFGVLIGGAIIGSRYLQCPKTEKAITSQEAGDKVIKYVNETLLAGQATASVDAITEENGMYKIVLKISSAGAADQKIDTYATKNGTLWFPQAYKLEEAANNNTGDNGATIGDFTISKEEICKENGKPIVYLFGADTCPYCKWETPIFLKVVEKFKDLVVFNNNMNATDKDQDIFSKYSTGGIPTIVLGCKYYRVGSGQQAGEETETKNLTALFCKLTGSQPSEVCSQVQDLIDQIKD